VSLRLLFASSQRLRPFLRDWRQLSAPQELRLHCVRPVARSPEWHSGHQLFFLTITFNTANQLFLPSHCFRPIQSRPAYPGRRAVRKGTEKGSAGRNTARSWPLTTWPAYGRTLPQCLVSRRREPIHGSGPIASPDARRVPRPRDRWRHRWTARLPRPRASRVS